MPTHTDNRHFGTVINDGLHVAGDMNAVDGIDLGAIMDYIPMPHDISAQCNGTTRQFTLDPPVMIPALKHITVILDGSTLTRSNVLAGDDYFVTGNGDTLVLGDTIGPPPSNDSSLVVYYIERLSL